MGVAVLVFSLVVGFFHYQGTGSVPGESRMFAREPDVPARYADPHFRSDSGGEPGVFPRPTGSSAGTAVVAESSPQSSEDLAQSVADKVAADPAGAASIMRMALSGTDEKTTLGEVATLAAAATRAAPDEAPAIAGALTHALKDRGDAVLAAAVATIISLVPEQSRDIGLVVGAIVGEDVEALGMVAQTVAIATGEATFNSLSEASGVSLAALMRSSASFGSAVPFDVPAYAAQLAPNPSRVAEGAALPSTEGSADSEM
jgi:hypothetical protein